jgi:dTDP-4-amino-4,6-dideoxygalactose transaminase
MSRTLAFGGDIELDPELLARSEAGPEVELEGVLCDSGRSALAVARRILERSADPPELYLLPAYLCASVLQPFAGAPVELYPVGEALEVDTEAIAEIARGRRACVVVIDYFGFPPSPEWIAALRDHVVVEDAAHGSLVELPDHAAGAFGDLTLTSFRKFAPVPDGALLAGPLAAAEPLEAVDEGLVEGRLRAKLLRHELLAGGPPGLEAESLALVERHEQALDSAPVAAMSLVSRRLLATLDLAAAAAARRANFEALRDALDGSPLAMELEALHDTLPAGVSPVVFPLRVPERSRDALRAELIRRRVYCPVHWPLPAAVSEEAFPQEAKLSRQMLGLPLDQRYEPEDMRELVERLHAAWHVTR